MSDAPAWLFPFYDPPDPAAVDPVIFSLSRKCTIHRSRIRSGNASSAACLDPRQLSRIINLENKITVCKGKYISVIRITALITVSLLMAQERTFAFCEQSKNLILVDKTGGYLAIPAYQYLPSKINKDTIIKGSTVAFCVYGDFSGTGR